MTVIDTRSRSLEDAVSAYKLEYDDQMANWRGLDSKAQGAVAVAGLFVGGLLSIANSPDRGEPTSGRLLFALALGLLVVAVLAALRALWVRNVSDPPSGDSQLAMARDLQGLDAAESASVDRYHRYLQDRASQWAAAVRDARKENDTKAAALMFAQACLVAAVIVVGVFGIIRMIVG